MTYHCQRNDGSIHDAKMKFINNGWVPACTICIQTIGDISDAIPPITGINVTLIENQIEVNWNPNKTYYTEIQIRQGNGAWKTLHHINNNITTKKLLPEQF